jgi:hypothetical protein
MNPRSPECSIFALCSPQTFGVLGVYLFAYLLLVNLPDSMRFRGDLAFRPSVPQGILKISILDMQMIPIKLSIDLAIPGS